MARRQTIDPLVRAKVVETWGNECWLNMPGCTHVGTEDDHIVPHSHGGRDTVANIRRACKHCNAARQDRILNGYGASIHALLAPPRADTQGWLEGRLLEDSVVVSFDSLRSSIYPMTDPPASVRMAAAMAWDGAYRALAKCSEPVDVWLVRTVPRSRSHPDMLGEWISLDYDIHVMDVPSADTFAHPLSPREERAARQWYALHLSQALVDARQRERRAKLVTLGLRSDRTQSSSRPEW